jgi:NADH-ubiquinone oxidoreductase chain 2
MSMYLSIELQSFGVYILATLFRNSESATSAGLKYFLLGGLSSCIILLGVSLIYTYTGLTNFESIYSIISVYNNNNTIQGLNLGLILIVIGLLFKIAAAPLHNWAPDVYDDSPTIVTIWLTIMPKISILILLLELQTQIGITDEITSVYINSKILESITYLNIDSSNFFNLITSMIRENTIYILKLLLLISSLLSLIIGTIVGLAQIRIKRLLAYSTISHIGFILLALAINTEQSIDSLIFYVIQYSITNLNTFLILIALGYVLKNSIIQNIQLNKNNKIYYNNEEIIKDIKYISELKSQFFFNPLLSLSLTICLFSMAGIPPLIGFFSKQFVLYSAVANGYYFMAIVAILVSVISASYYLKIIKILHTETEDIILNEISSKPFLIKDKNFNYISTIKNEILNINNNKDSKLLINNFHSFLISTLTLIILLFVFKPSIILNSTQLLSLSLFNF